MLLVYSDITRRGAHAYIPETYQRVKFLEPNFHVGTINRPKFEMTNGLVSCNVPDTRVQLLQKEMLCLNRG